MARDETVMAGGGGRWRRHSLGVAHMPREKVASIKAGRTEAMPAPGQFGATKRSNWKGVVAPENVDPPGARWGEPAGSGQSRSPRLTHRGADRTVAGSGDMPRRETTRGA